MEVLSILSVFDSPNEFPDRGGGESTYDLMSISIPMSEVQKGLDPLPSEKFCNKFPPYNHPSKKPRDGPLGNEKTGRMYYVGKGDKEKLVINLQKMLKTLGYVLGTTGPNNDGIDGKFWDLTEEAVLDFQGKNKDWGGEPLKEDGLVGPETSDAFNRAMVGKQYEKQKWYDHYQTPEELVDGKPYHTVTSDYLKSGLLIKSGGAKEAKVFLVGRVLEPFGDTHISLVLYSEQNPRPLANCTYRLYLNNSVVEGHTDQNGFMEHNNVEAGDYKLEIAGGTTFVPAVSLATNQLGWMVMGSKKPENDV